MTKNILPTPEQLRELLTYDPKTGKLFWKERPERMFKDTPGRTKEHAHANWNSRYAGKEAFTAAHGEGYRQGLVFGWPYLAHRVIWAIVYGEWPVNDIDHINMDRSDNRLANLRHATRGENTCNRGAQINNTSGFKGVTWDKRSMKWMAQIGAFGKNHNLGLFATAEEAHAAYRSASQRMHGEFSRTS